jgi:hypothetical protein
MEITQIIISISLSVITVIIVICAIYFIGLLKELKKTIATTNSILDDAKSITTSVSRPISSISDFIMGFKNSFSFMNKLFNKSPMDSDKE